MKNKQLSKDFGKFLFVGALWTGLSIFLAWFLIDFIGMYASITSIIIVSMGIVIRFYSYVLIRLIKKQFLKFVSANLLFSLLTVILMTITIDVMKIPTLIATPSIIGGLFVLKFFTFIKIKMISYLL